MKTLYLLPRVLLVLFFGAISARAQVAIWTNHIPGVWNATTNWANAHVPVAGDTVYITNGVTNVSLNVTTPALGALYVRGSGSCGVASNLSGFSGTDLFLSNNILELGGPLTIGSCGAVYTSGGTIDGVTNASISGFVGFNGGELTGTLTFNANATLVIDTNLAPTTVVAASFENGEVINEGTVIWNNSTIAMGGGAGEVIYNSGTWEANCDGEMLDSYGGTCSFSNSGTLVKTTGSATNQTEFGSSVELTNTGNVNITVGTLELEGGGSFTGGYMTNLNGIVQLISGNYNINGTSTAATVIDAGGNLIGANTIQGALTWSNGDWNSAISVVVSGTSTLVIDDAGGLNELGGCLLVNDGTVDWLGGHICGGNGEVIFNAGTWNCECDQTFDDANFGGNIYFTNVGTFEKTASVNTTTFGTGLEFFQDAGAINVASGIVQMQDGGVLSGGTATGFSGLLLLENGNFTINGTVTSTNVWDDGAALTGFNILQGALTWTNGSWSGANVTVSNGCVLLVQGDSGLNELGNATVLTNLGTVAWSSGHICGGGGAIVINSGLWDCQGDLTFDDADFGGNIYFTNTVSGVVRKSAGVNSTVFGTGLNFTSYGIIDTKTATLSLQDGGNLFGGLATNLNGVLQLTAGNFTINGAYTATSVIQTGGNLVGNNLIQGALVWSNGNWTGSSVTVANNGILYINDNGGLDSLGDCLFTNLGTVDWLAGHICGGGGAIVINAGTWNCECDQTFDDANFGGSVYFTNTGTFNKTGTVNVTTLGSGMNFSSSGTFNVASGTVEMTAGGTFNGGTATNMAGLLLLEGGNFTINGTVTCSNVWDYGGALAGLNILQGALSWSNGNWTGSTVTVSNGCTLYVEGGSGLNQLGSCTLTNLGTVAWLSGHICGGSGEVIDNYGLWNCEGDLTFDDSDFGGNIYFTNFGTFRKSIGTNTTAVAGGTYFFNDGILDAQTGIIALENVFNLSAGTMNFGLNSLTNYGHVSLTGTAVLGGGITANLNNGYVPIGGNSFNVVSFGSSSGAFTSTNLPFADAWGTNYTSTNFNLAVLNARPSITTPPTQYVDELTTMTATNTATDPDQPPQTLTFSLVSAPAGMTINSSTGVMTWTPPQTNSPSTNTVTVAVTDNGTPPLSATNSFTVIVIEVNQAPTLPAIANQTVDVLATLTVTNTATNSNIHSTNVGYKITGPSGVSITTNGIITWTPTQSEGPNTNTITTVVTNYNSYAPVNNYLTATNSFQVIVYAPTLAPISNFTNNPGQTVSFTASATDNDPTRALTFSLGTAPAGATINSSSGLFSWRPPVADASTTNIVQVKVTANSTPSDTITQSFDIVVRPLALVTLTPISETPTNYVIQINGTAGPDYILQSLGSFQGGTWSNILTNTPPSLPFDMTATNVTATNGFYRIKLGP